MFQHPSRRGADGSVVQVGDVGIEQPFAAHRVTEGGHDRTVPALTQPESGAVTTTLTTSGRVGEPRQLTAPFVHGGNISHPLVVDALHGGDVAPAERTRAMPYS